MLDYSQMPVYLADFLKYMQLIRMSSERTVVEYYQDLRVFLRYVAKQSGMDTEDISTLPLSAVKAVDLRILTDFQMYLLNDRSNTSRSRARKLSALRGFFSFLYKQGMLESNPCANLEKSHIKKTIPKFLTLEQSEKLLEGTEDTRDYCIITLFLNCGMRLSELVGLNLRDVNFQDMSLRLLGKGNKERLVYFNDACKAALDDYLSVRRKPDPPTDALFISKFNKRISRRRVQQIVDEALAAAQLDGQGFSTHKLRHTAATLMYRYGDADALVLKEILGHSSVVTTEIYTHINDEKKRDAVENSPLAEIKRKKKKDE